MKGLRLLLVCLLALVTLSGCAGMTIGEHFKKNGLGKAAFAMNCPQDQITLIPLSKPLTATMYQGGLDIGVDGCGKRLVYVYVADVGWVLNSESAGQ